MNYKMATEADLPQIMKLWDYCFEKKDDPFFQWYFQKYCLTENVVVGGFAEADGQLVNMLHLNPYEIFLRGKKELVPYIVGVATDPAMRGQGLTQSLLRASFRILRYNTSPFVFLMPIYAGIYQTYDFAFCYNKQVYEIPLAQLQISSFSDDLRIERYTSYSGELFNALYDAMADGYNGLTIRGTFEWEKLLLTHQLEQMQVAVVYYGNIPRGYMFYKIRDDRTFFIQELIALTSDAKRALLHFAKMHLAMADKIYWEAMEDDLTWLDFPDAALCPRLKPFMMARCFDSYQALQEYSLPPDCPDGRVTVLLRDDLLEWNNHLLTLVAENGRLTVKEADEPAEVVLSAGAFTQLCFGAYTASQLLGADKIKMRGYLPEALAFLDQLFPKCVNFINEYY